MASVAQKRKEENIKIQQRDMEVAAKFAKLEQWKKELNDKINKKTAEVQAAKVKLVTFFLLFRFYVETLLLIVKSID